MALSPQIQKKIAALGLQEAAVYATLSPDCLVFTHDVTPNLTNPKTCQDERLLAIAASLKAKTWIASELPLVWQDPEGVKPYTLINGEHRWMIASMAGFVKFPVIIASAVKSREDAMALSMALEEATARRDKGKWVANLMELAASGRDDDLRNILRIKDPEALRAQREKFANRLQAQAAEGGVANAAPKLVSLTFTGAQYEAYQEAIGKARTRLKMAGETIGMLEELADRDVVALAAMMRGDGDAADTVGTE